MLVLLNGGASTQSEAAEKRAPLADACVTEWRTGVNETGRYDARATR